MTSERNGHRLPGLGQSCRTELCRPCLHVFGRRALAPLRDGLGVNPQFAAQLRERSLRSLYCCIVVRTACVIVALPWRICPIGHPSIPKKRSHHQTVGSNRPWERPIGRPRPPFGAPGSTPSGAFSDVSHRSSSYRFPAPARQFGHDGSEHSHSAPALPAVVERLRGTRGGRCVFSHQPVALNKDHTAQHASVVKARPAS